MKRRIVLIAMLATGLCASGSGLFGQDRATGEVAVNEAMPCDGSVDRLGESIDVEYGTSRPLVDGTGWVLGIPRKLYFWDRRADNHQVSDATVGEVADYLELQGLSSTKIRVNQYAPIDEWKRLVRNRKMSPGWKYTVGSLKWVKYTVLPGRLFGRDEYNPFTDSLYLYSDMPTLGLAESAYAKDVSRRPAPGAYAAVQTLPIATLWHETIATKEVIRYVSYHGSSEDFPKVRHDLYTRYGLELAGSASQVLPDGSGLFAVIGAVGGHAVAANENRQGD